MQRWVYTEWPDVQEVGSKMRPPIWFQQLGTVTQGRVREAAQASHASNQLSNVARLLTHRSLKTHTKSTRFSEELSTVDGSHGGKKCESKPSVAREASARLGRRSQQGLLTTREWG